MYVLYVYDIMMKCDLQTAAAPLVKKASVKKKKTLGGLMAGGEHVAEINYNTLQGGRLEEDNDLL